MYSIQICIYRVQTKNMKKFAWAVGLVAIGFLVYSVSNSFLLDFTDINVESLRQRFSEVNFIGPGNDFGGAIFRLDAKNLSTWFIIEHSTGITYEKKSCMTQVRGIYYNNQRGLRMRPLDTASLTMLRATSTGYFDLQMTGWFFRDCTNLVWGVGSGDIYSIFGYIEYTLSGDSSAITSSLAAGVKLNYPANAMMTWLTNNFQYFNNTTPLWYIYDSNGGIGFVWGKLLGNDNLITFLNTGDNSINDAFIISGITIVSTNPWSTGRDFIASWIDTAQDTLWKLLIQWTVGLSKSINSQQRLSLLGNPEKRTVIYGGTEINSSTILNLARKNAQNLCRGKAWNTEPLTELPAVNGNIICIKDSPNLTINLNTDGMKYQNKTLVLQNNSNVTLTGTMQNGYGPVEIFIDQGNLFINTNAVPPYVRFNVDWFPVSSSWITQWMYLKGNFIIYGLIIGTGGGGMTGFNHKLHIEGKVVSLNSPSEPSQGRKDQVNALFGTGTYEHRINLENTFIWTCAFSGSGSDGTPCSTWWITSLVPFVILNGNFPGNLLQ